jgi:hypothetical protein
MEATTRLNESVVDWVQTTQMKTIVSRRFVINVALIVVLLAALPGAVHRLIETRDAYLFTEQFFDDMYARLSGPGRLRFILQPTVAVFLGVRDGVRDYREGVLPFLWVCFQKKLRSKAFVHAFRSIRDLVAIAIVLDVIFQFIIFDNVHPGAALLLGPVLIAVPYAVSRSLTTQFGGRKIVTHQ